MTDQIQFTETTPGKLALKLATAKLTKLGVPQSSTVAASVEDFLAQVAGITVPSTLAGKTAAMEPQLADAKAAFNSTLQTFCDECIEPQEAPLDSGRAGGSLSQSSARIQVDGMSGSALFQFPPGGARAATGSSSGGAAEEAHNAAKRQRLGMSDSDLARACTAMDMPAAKVTPQFLVDKPLDVRMYTPLLVDLYASVRKMAEGVSLLAREVYVFEGDFLELSRAAVAALPTTPLFASCDMTTGSRLLHRLEVVHSVAVQLRAKNLRCQRGFWLANHTPGCNWDTWEQLCHREDQDAGADLCNPCFTPLASWEEQVKAAIAAARQEAAALSKDGKTLLGPILPRLLARHGLNSDWRNKGTVGPKTTDRNPRAKTFTPRRPPAGALAVRKAGGANKENRNRNAASAPPAPKPAASRPAAQKPADT
jgi:hypothetical protein